MSSAEEPEEFGSSHHEGDRSEDVRNRGRGGQDGRSDRRHGGSVV